MAVFEIPGLENPELGISERDVLEWEAEADEALRRIAEWTKPPRPKPPTAKAREDLHRRIESTRRSFLTYYNALNAPCMYFEWPVETEQQELEACRISLEAWERSENFMRFAAVRPPVFRYADYDLASQWVDHLHCPMYCMETDGDTALFLCETHIFEVRSFGERWENLIPHTPALVLATLVACDKWIASDGDVEYPLADMSESEIEAVTREFERRKAENVIWDVQEFQMCAHALTQLHERTGLDSVAFTAYSNYVEAINDATSETCFPHEITLKARG